MRGMCFISSRAIRVNIALGSSARASTHTHTHTRISVYPRAILQKNSLAIKIGPSTGPGGTSPGFAQEGRPVGRPDSRATVNFSSARARSLLTTTSYLTSHLLSTGGTSYGERARTDNPATRMTQAFSRAARKRPRNYRGGIVYRLDDKHETSTTRRPFSAHLDRSRDYRSRRIKIHIIFRSVCVCARARALDGHR